MMKHCRWWSNPLCSVALESAKRIQASQLVEEGAVLVWNLALQLLERGLRKHVRGALGCAAAALEAMKSPNLDLLSRLRLELAQCEVTEDFYMKASGNVDAVLAMDYAEEGHRSLDRRAQLMKTRIDLRRNLYQEPDNVLDRATLLLEQAKDTTDAHLRENLLSRAVAGIEIAEMRDAFETVQIWSDVIVAASAFNLVDLVDVSAEKVAALGTPLAKQEPLVARMVMNARMKRMEMLAYRIRHDETCPKESKLLGAKVTPEVEDAAAVVQWKEELVKEAREMLSLARALGLHWAIQNALVYLWNYHVEVLEGNGFTGEMLACLRAALKEAFDLIMEVEADKDCSIPLEIRCKFALAMVNDCERSGDISRAVDLAQGFLQRVPASLHSVDLHRAIYRMRPTHPLPPVPSTSDVSTIDTHIYLASATKIIRASFSNNNMGTEIADAVLDVVQSASEHLSNEACSERFVPLAEALFKAGSTAIAESCCNKVERSGKWGCLAGCLMGRILHSRIHPNRQSVRVQEKLLARALEECELALKCAKETRNSVLVEYSAGMMYDLGITSQGNRGILVKPFEAAAEALEQYSKGVDDTLQGKLLLVVLTALKDETEWKRGLSITETKLSKLKLPVEIQRQLWELAVVFNCKVGRDPSIAIHNLHQSDPCEMANLWIIVAHASTHSTEQLAAHINAVQAVESDKSHPTYAKALLHLAKWEFMNGFQLNEIRCVLISAIDALRSPAKSPAQQTRSHRSLVSAVDALNNTVEIEVVYLMVVSMAASLAPTQNERIGFLLLASRAVDACCEAVDQAEMLDIYAHPGNTKGDSEEPVFIEDPTMPLLPPLLALVDLFCCNWMHPCALKLLLLLLVLLRQERSDMIAMIQLRIAAVHAAIGREDLHDAWATAAYAVLPSENERLAQRKELVRSNKGFNYAAEPGVVSGVTSRRRESGKEMRRVWVHLAQALLNEGKLKQCELLLEDVSIQNTAYVDEVGRFQERLVRSELCKVKGDADRCVSILLQLLQDPQQVDACEVDKATLALVDVLRSMDRHEDIIRVASPTSSACQTESDTSIDSNTFAVLIRLERLRSMLALKQRIAEDLEHLIALFVQPAEVSKHAAPLVLDRVEPLILELLLAVKQGALQPDCLRKASLGLPRFLARYRKALAAQSSIVRPWFDPSMRMPCCSNIARLHVLAAELEASAEGSEEGSRSDDVVQQWLRDSVVSKSISASAEAFRSLGFACCKTASVSDASLFQGRARAAIGAEDGISLLEEACHRHRANWELLEPAALDLFFLAKQYKKEDTAVHALLWFQSAGVSQAIFDMALRFGTEGKLGLCHRLRERSEAAASLLNATTICKMLDCSVDTGDLLQKTCTGRAVRFVSLSYSPWHEHMLVAVVSADKEGQLCYESAATHVANADLEELHSEMRSLRTDMREWMVDYGSDNTGNGEVEGQGTDDKSERAINEVLAKLLAVLGNAIEPLNDAIHAIETGDGNRPKLVILCDVLLSALPLEALFNVDKFSSVSREFGLALMSQRMKNLEENQALKNGTLQYMFDPKNEDNSGVISETLTSMKKGDWSGQSGEQGTPNAAEWQQTLKGIDGSQHGFLFLGLSRMLAYIKPTSLVHLNLCNCRFLICLDRAPNDDNLAAQIKADNKRAATDIELEDPHCMAALFAALGVGNVVTVQWSNVLQTNVRLAVALLENEGPKGVSSLAERLSEFRSSENFKNRVRLNPVYYGLPWTTP